MALESCDLIANMLTTSILAVALAGVATAVTPSGFTPASTKDLFVSFGNTLAVNGVDLPKDSKFLVNEIFGPSNRTSNPDSTYSRNH